MPGTHQQWSRDGWSHARAQVAALTVSCVDIHRLPEVQETVFPQLMLLRTLQIISNMFCLTFPEKDGCWKIKFWHSFFYCFKYLRVVGGAVGVLQSSVITGCTPGGR